MADASVSADNSKIDPLSDAVILSDYARKLSPEARHRYGVKLLWDYGRSVLPDPYSLTAGWCDDPSWWPDLGFGDIYCYLIDTPGKYTTESLKAYKSLDAYRFVVSGHVQLVEYHDLGGSPYCALKAKVVPSQRVTEKPHQPWTIIEKDTGCVYCAHCTCMAGLGEVCSHVAALLFKIEMGVRLGLSTSSSTSQACQWNRSFRKEVTPVTIEDLQLTIKGRRTKPVPSVIPTGRDPLPDHTLLESLKAVCPSAVFFSTIAPLDPEETVSASSTGENRTIMQPLRDLYHCSPASVTTPIEELNVLADQAWKNYKCSEEQVIALEEATRGQSVSHLWYEQRKGRITGTKAHNVLVRKENTSPVNLVKTITGSTCYNLSRQKAVKWGRDNEDRARGEYMAVNSASHQHLHVRPTGLLVHHPNPFLAVSADGIVTCHCCQKRVLEIKCPFKHRSSSITDAVLKDKSFCLDRNLNLKPQHRYFTQVQLQMLIHQTERCDFFVFTNVDSITVQVKKDVQFCETLVSKSELFFRQHLLPELLTRKLETCEAVDDAPEEPHEGDVWCLCQEPAYGRMIQCKNTDCPTQWFHYECVNIRRCPRKEWLCPECTD